MHPSTAAQHTCAMMRLGALRGFLSAVLAVALVAPALDTAWTSRTPSVTSLVDPSLRAGEVALVHTTTGHAGALSTSLAQLGATDLETDAAADTVVARLSPAALDAIRTDARVTVATSDITVAANGSPRGVAPGASLVSLRVLDAQGNGKLSGVVKAFDWLLRNGKRLGVQVLNVSWGAPQATSYHKDLLSALVEAAWFSGITVVVAVGNDGPDAGTVTAPATDPFVVSVGSYNDMGTLLTSDDVASTFTARGPTLDGFADRK